MNAPWYRQLWPWLILSGPAAVMVAGAATIWIAFASADGLVAEDYYRQGMAINKVLAREEQAKRLGIAVQVKMERDAIRIQLEGARPDVLFVHLVHATRAGHDQRLRLAPAGGGGAYAAGLEPLPPGRWRIVIEDPRATWRIVKEAS